VRDCVDVIGRDPRGEHFTDRGQRIRRDASGGPHDLDLLGGVEVVAAALIGVGASDVSGAGDVLRHTAFGGEGAGSEWASMSCHDDSDSMGVVGLCPSSSKSVASGPGWGPTVEAAEP